MSQENAGVSGEARNGAPRLIVRPLSPHLQVWRFHQTMLGSILHRITGVGLYIGAALVVAWLAALAAGPDAYETFAGLMGSPLGLLIWFGFSVSAFYHLAAGVRHLIWDLGRGLNIKNANFLTTASFVFTIVATIAFWAWLLSSGKVSL